MAKKLYIGNLAPEVNEDDLRNNFKESGDIVSVQILRDRYTGASRGFGFVEMSTDQEAAEVIKSFNGAELCGKRLVVNEARPREESRRGGGKGRRGGGGGYGRGGGRRY